MNPNKNDNETDLEIEAPQYQVPKKTDVLFAGDQALWEMDAMLDFAPAKEALYRQGYRRAGLVLTGWVAKHGEQDFLVFPICHAYRHYVELALKALIPRGCRVMGRTCTTDEMTLLNSTHNLMRLWGKFLIVEAEVCQNVGPATPPGEIEGIEAYIKQLDAIDSKSFAFRYPRTKQGESSLPGVERINLARFSGHMEKLCNYLDGYEAFYDHMIEIERDMSYGC